MSEHEIIEQFSRGISKKSLASSVYFSEHRINTKYTKIDAMAKVEQIILKNYLRQHLKQQSS